MDNEAIKKFFTQFVENLKGVVVKYPVEYAIFIYAYIATVTEYPKFTDLPEYLYLIPAFVCLAYIVNKLCASGLSRYIYYAIFLAFIPCQLFIPIDMLIGRPPFVLTTFLILPVGVLLSGINYSDRSFVRNILSLALSCALVAFIILFVILLIYAIINSFTLIFGFESITSDLLFHFTAVIGWLITPLVFFAFYEQIKTISFKPIKLLNIVMNYIFTPAIWVYLLIMYAYVVKIVSQWMLPNGDIASLTFGFMVVVIVARALYQFVGTKPFKKFYSLLSWIIFPVLILFWVGTITRINEYGFTEMRVYMVLSGILVTIHTLLFTTKIKMRYTIFSGAIIVAFAFIAYIPFYNAKQISVRSQIRVAESIARELNVLNKNNKIDISLLSKITTDTIGKRETLNSAIAYVHDNDSALAINKFGVSNIEAAFANYPAHRDYYIIFFPKNQEKRYIGGFKALYNYVSSTSNGDIIEIKISGNKKLEIASINRQSLFNAYIKAIGDNATTFKANMLRDNHYYVDRSSIIEVDSLSIQLNSIEFNKDINTVNNISIDYILVK